MHVDATHGDTTHAATGIAIAWWAVAGAVLSLMIAEAVISSVHGMDTWLLDTGCCGMVACLIDSRLQLFEEAVDFLEIILRSSVGQWKLVAVRSKLRYATTSRHATAAGERVEEASCGVVTRVVASGAGVVSGVVAAAHGKRKGIALDARADIIVRAGIDGTTLDISEEVVECFDGASAGVHALDVCHGSVGWVADGAVGGVLTVRRGWITAVLGTAHRWLISRVWVTHTTIMLGWVIAGCCHHIRPAGSYQRVWVCECSGLTLSVLLSHATSTSHAAAVVAGCRRVHQHTVVGVRLHMLLEILRAFECLSTEVALMRLEWDMDADVRGDVVAFDGRGAASTPLAGEVEVVGALAADMALADVVLAVRLSCVWGMTTACIVLSVLYLHRGLRRSRIARHSLATGR